MTSDQISSARLLLVPLRVADAAEMAGVARRAGLRPTGTVTGGEQLWLRDRHAAQ